jgi:hypothetical protein
LIYWNIEGNAFSGIKKNGFAKHFMLFLGKQGEIGKALPATGRGELEN